MSNNINEASSDIFVIDAGVNGGQSNTDAGAITGLGTNSNTFSTVKLNNDFMTDEANSRKSSDVLTINPTVLATGLSFVDCSGFLGFTATGITVASGQIVVGDVVNISNVGHPFDNSYEIISTISPNIFCTDYPYLNTTPPGS